MIWYQKTVTLVHVCTSTFSFLYRYFFLSKCLMMISIMSWLLIPEKLPAASRSSIMQQINSSVKKRKAEAAVKRSEKKIQDSQQTTVVTAAPEFTSVSSVNRYLEQLRPEESTLSDKSPRKEKAAPEKTFSEKFEEQRKHAETTVEKYKSNENDLLDIKKSIEKIAGVAPATKLDKLEMVTELNNLRKKVKQLYKKVTPPVDTPSEQKESSKNKTDSSVDQNKAKELSTTIDSFFTPGTKEYEFKQKGEQLFHENAEEIAVFRAFARDIDRLNSKLQKLKASEAKEPQRAKDPDRENIDTEKESSENFLKKAVAAAPEILSIERQQLLDYKKKSREMDPLFVDQGLIKKAKKQEDLIIKECEKAVKNLDTLIKLAQQQGKDNSSYVVKKNEILKQKILIEEEQVIDLYNDALKPKAGRQAQEESAKKLQYKYKNLLDDYQALSFDKNTDQSKEQEIKMAIKNIIDKEIPENLTRYTQEAERRKKLIERQEKNLEKTIEAINEKSSQEASDKQASPDDHQTKITETIYQALALNEQKNRIALVHPELFELQTISETPASSEAKAAQETEGAGETVASQTNSQSATEQINLGKLNENIKTLDALKSETFTYKKWNIPQILTVTYLLARSLLPGTGNQKKNASAQSQEAQKIASDPQLSMGEKFNLLRDVLTKGGKSEATGNVLSSKVTEKKDRENQKKALDLYKDVRFDLEKGRLQQEESLQKSYESWKVKEQEIKKLEAQIKEAESLSARGQAQLEEAKKKFDEFKAQATQKATEILEEGKEVVSKFGDAFSQKAGEAKEFFSNASDTLASGWSAFTNMISNSPIITSDQTKTLATAATQKPAKPAALTSPGEVEKKKKEQELKAKEKELSDAKKKQEEEQVSHKQRIEALKQQLTTAKQEQNDILTTMRTTQGKIHQYDRLIENYTTEHLHLLLINNQSLTAAKEKAQKQSIIDKLGLRKKEETPATIQESIRENKTQLKEIFAKTTEQETRAKKSASLITNPGSNVITSLPPEARVFEASRLVYEQRAIKNLYGEFGRSILGKDEAQHKFTEFMKNNTVTPVSPQEKKSPAAATPTSPVEEKLPKTEENARTPDDQAPDTQVTQQLTHQQIIDQLLADLPQETKIYQETIGLQPATFTNRDPRAILSISA